MEHELISDLQSKAAIFYNRIFTGLDAKSETTIIIISEWSCFPCTLLNILTRKKYDERVIPVGYVF